MKEITQRLLDNFYDVDYGDLRPTTLNVEVTNCCNLKCVMCPTASMKRPKGFMDIELFRFFLDEAIELGVTQVGLHTVGESILHPEIESFIRISKLKGVYTYLDINGNIFREGLHEKIIDAGLDSLKFSIDAPSQELYARIRKGGNLAVVFENLKKIDSLRKAKGSKMRLFALYTISKLNEDYVDEFVEMLKPYVDEVEISVVMNQGEQFEGYDELVPDRLSPLLERHRRKTVCPNPFKRLVLSWDGYLTACCIDFELNLIYGRYEKGRLKELWNNEIITDIRTKMQNLELEQLGICSNCDMACYDIPAILKTINEELGGMSP